MGIFLHDLTHAISPRTMGFCVFITDDLGDLTKLSLLPAIMLINGLAAAWTSTVQSPRQGSWMTLQWKESLNLYYVGVYWSSK